MEAETKGLREDIWSAAEREASIKESARPRRMTFARMIIVASVFLLALELPLSVEQDRPYDPFEIGSVEMLTSTEAEILTELRKTLVSGNAGRIYVTVEAPAETASVQETGPAPTSGQKDETRAAAKIKAAETQVKKAPEKNDISMEEVITLIQIGERAIRGHTVPIRGLQ